MHVGLNHNGYLPEFITTTDGKTYDITAARALKLPAGSIIAVDKGYNDYQWYNSLNNKGIYFVTRSKNNAKYRVLERLDVDKSKGITSDQVIQFTGSVTTERCPIALQPESTTCFWLKTDLSVLRPLQRYIRLVGKKSCSLNGTSRIVSDQQTPSKS